MNIQKTIFASAFALSLGLVGLAGLSANAQTSGGTMTPGTMNSGTMMTSYDAVLGFAKLKTVAAPTTGSFAIIKKTDGNTVLRLQEIKTEPGPDLHVYLYAGAVPSKTATAKAVKAVKFLDLGKLGAPFSGSFEYNIPSATNLAQYKSVIIWCDQAGATFAGASLN